MNEGKKKSWHIQRSKTGRMFTFVGSVQNEIIRSDKMPKFCIMSIIEIIHVLSIWIFIHVLSGYFFLIEHWKDLSYRKHYTPLEMEQGTTNEPPVPPVPRDEIEDRFTANPSQNLRRKVRHLKII